MMKSARGSAKGVPESVYRLVVAEVGDYDRKKKALEKGGLSREKMVEYGRKVAVIDTAMESVCLNECPEAKRALMADISSMRGYKNGEAREFYTTKGTYIRRKRQALTIIAKLLELM